MVNINVEVDEATHKAVKIRAVEEGKLMKTFIVDVLREATKGEKERGEKKRDLLEAKEKKATEKPTIKECFVCKQNKPGTFVYLCFDCISDVQ